MDATGRSVAVLVALSKGAQRSLFAARPPRTRSRGRLRRSGRCHWASPGRARPPVRGAARPTRAGPRTTSTTGGATTAGTLSFSVSASRSRTRPSRSRSGRLGPGDGSRDARRDLRASNDRRRRRARCARSAARRWSSRATRTRSRTRPRRWGWPGDPRRTARDDRRRRSHPERARPRPVNLAIREFIALLELAPERRRSRRPDLAASRTAGWPSAGRRPDRVGGRSARAIRPIVFLPSAPIVHSRQWKGQVPYLSRLIGHRVRRPRQRSIGSTDHAGAHTARAPGRDLEASWTRPEPPRPSSSGCAGTASGGRSSWRPPDPDASRDRGLCGRRPTSLAAAPSGVGQWSFDDELPTDEGWAKVNRHYWRRDYAGFARFFFDRSRPSRTRPRQIEDAVELGARGIGRGDDRGRRSRTRHGLPRSRPSVAPWPCPMLLVHGSEDHCQPVARARSPAELTGAPLVGGRGRRSHDPGPPSGARRTCSSATSSDSLRRRPDEPGHRRTTWTRALARRRRALYISSPIGLGHAQRDVAIADELRKLHPDLEIDWLAQHPVTRSSRRTASGSTR